jgi:hypothetical protein
MLGVRVPGTSNKGLFTECVEGLFSEVRLTLILRSSA